MKNITKKSLCLMLGVILCQGVAWGMDKKTFRFSDEGCDINMFFNGSNATENCKELLENYKKDLYGGKIGNYKKELKAFKEMNDKIKTTKVGTRYQDLYDLTWKNAGSDKSRELLKLFENVSKDLVLFTNIKCLLTEEEPVVDLFEKSIKENSYCSTYKKIFSKENVVFDCPDKMFNLFVESEGCFPLGLISLKDQEKLISLKGISDVFPQIYSDLLFSGKIVDPLKEWDCLNKVFNKYKERCKGFSKDAGTETIAKICRVTGWLKKTKMALEKYFKIKEIVINQISFKERFDYMVSTKEGEVKVLFL